MRRKQIVLLVAVIGVILAGCGKQMEPALSEEPIDCGGATMAAKREFESRFADYQDLEITECATVVRTNDDNRFIVQFKYTSDDVDGEYGFELEKTETGLFNIIQQGEKITADNLVNE